ncbi:hypothetical protein GLYMA_06G062367v4 [Glycine max]|nr:hypothetical protein GLYMA_06G062367v4 [Glycine max]KAH1124423.1 hypothetical protein GYH30_014242 [Glycine max]
MLSIFLQILLLVSQVKIDSNVLFPWLAFCINNRKFILKNLRLQI